MIFFDIDGTLVDHKGAERAAALAFHMDHTERFHESPESFLDLWQSLADKHVQRYLAGQVSFQGQRRARIRDLFGDHEMTDGEADIIFAKYLHRYEENWRLFGDVAPCLQEMTDVNLGIISNGDSQQQRAKLGTLGIASHFSTVLISGDINTAKPDCGIFAAACRAEGLRPDECVYVGDDLDVDARGSVRAGMRGIWLNRNGKPCPDGVEMITTLRELRNQIGLHNKALLGTARKLAAREG
jgi:putative hydrolase of the HAD superfamily